MSIYIAIQFIDNTDDIDDQVMEIQTGGLEYAKRLFGLLQNDHVKRIEIMRLFEPSNKILATWDKDKGVWHSEEFLEGKVFNT